MASRGKRRRPNAPAILGAAALALQGCAFLAPLPPPSDVEARLATLPTDDLPVERPVTIRWNEHQVPYIEAETDGDAAFALGLVHAHLRLGQMEVARRVAAGRLSEMGGPIAIDIDKALKTLGYDRAVDQILADMPAGTRTWLEAYVAGVNHYQRTMVEPPHEYRVLGFDRRETWQVRDVVTIGRLASSDVNWLVFFALLPQREREDWPRIWREALALGGAGAPGGTLLAADGPGMRLAASVLAGYAKSGSNSVAIAGSRSQSGAALMANDPHLGISLPNIWVLVGLKSPSYHVVGLTAPGVPGFAIGRNHRIAWGGTNLRAASSDLVDVADLPPEAFDSEELDVGVRYWFDSSVTVRTTTYGPVVSDAAAVPAPEGRVLALRWVGHQPTDELTALLRASQATDFESFRRAFAEFAVPGQNMLYADVDGNIGHLIAARLPRRAGPPTDVIVDVADHEAAWAKQAGTTDLPFLYNPPRGYVASANDPPFPSEVPLSFFFSASDRAARLGALVEENGRVDLETLKAWQRDTLSPTSRALRDAAVARIDALGLAPTGGAAEALQEMRAWDGYYRVDSRGALAFQAFLATLAPAFYAALDQANDLTWVSRSGYLKAKLLADLDKLDDAAAARVFGQALDAASETLKTYEGWGEIHRLPIAHALANLPLIGGRYRFEDLPVGGTEESLMKTAHEVTAERHRTFYGSQSRHVSDLADADANYFVLLGGQDGWLNSSTFHDQVALWRQGRYIRMPMSADAIRDLFPRVTVLQPQAR